MPIQQPTTEKYGLHPDQTGDLYLPAVSESVSPSRLSSLSPSPSLSRPSVVCLLHGGFWRMPYLRDQMHDIALDLAAHGFAVWNLEYRRIGDTIGTWRDTCADVIAGIQHLTVLATNGVDLDLDRIAVVGHSAGGHLALWAAKQVRVAGVVGLAPVADLVQAYDLGVGGSAITDLLGGTPTERPADYQAASPITRLPLGIPQLIIHGTADEIVPIELSRAYVQAAANDPITLLEMAGMGHMEYLDPTSAAHLALREWLAGLFSTISGSH